MAISKAISTVEFGQDHLHEFVSVPSIKWSLLFQAPIRGKNRVDIQHPYKWAVTGAQHRSSPDIDPRCSTSSSAEKHYGQTSKRRAASEPTKANGWNVSCGLFGSIFHIKPPMIYWCGLWQLVCVLSFYFCRKLASHCRNLLDFVKKTFKEMLGGRPSYDLCFECPVCSKGGVRGGRCDVHLTSRCTRDQCIHYVTHDELLSREDPVCSWSEDPTRTVIYRKQFTPWFKASEVEVGTTTSKFQPLPKPYPQHTHAIIRNYHIEFNIRLMVMMSVPRASFSCAARFCRFTHSCLALVLGPKLAKLPPAKLPLVSTKTVGTVFLLREEHLPSLGYVRIVSPKQVME